MKRILFFGFLLARLTGFSQQNLLFNYVEFGNDLTDSVPFEKGKKKFWNKQKENITKDTTISDRIKDFRLLRWQNGNNSEQIYKSGEITQVTHSGYISYMHAAYNIPVAVSHSIVKKTLMEPLDIDRSDSYEKDPLYTKLKSNLYRSSGYDHGHLAPAADFKFSEDQYFESFYMTNMTPQHGCFNQKGWCFLESTCRKWAKNEPDYVFYIISGPIIQFVGTNPVFEDTLCVNSTLNVYVPSFYYKVVMAYNETTKDGKAIGFIVPNENVESNEVFSMKMSVDEVERATGLNFFSYLPTDIERKLEYTIGAFDFTIMESDCPNKTCATVYNNRVLPENRTKLKCK